MSKIRLTLESFTAVLEEKVKNMNDNNDKDHKEILKQIGELTLHVNHENEQMDIRVTNLERTKFEQIITWRTLAKIGGTVLTLSGTIITLIKVVFRI